MNKNRTIKKFSIALLLCAITFPLWAQTDAADETNNSTASVSESQAATNAPAFQFNLAAVAKDKFKRTNSNGLVRIEGNGINVILTISNVQTNNAGLVRIEGNGIDVKGVEPGGQNALGIIARAFADNLEDIAEAAIIFATPVAIVVAVLYFLHRRNKLAHESLCTMIEKGVSVTPELIASLKSKGKNDKEVRTVRYLLPGLILVGFGIGVMVHAGKPGLSILLMGVAFLIVWLVERKKNDDGQRTVSVTKQGIQIVEGKPDNADQPPKP